MGDQLNSSSAAGTVVVADGELKPEVNQKGLSCSEVRIYLLSISSRKSFLELSVPAGLHQASEFHQTGLVRNGANDCVLKKPTRGVLTKPICHGQS